MAVNVWSPSSKSNVPLQRAEKLSGPTPATGAPAPQSWSIGRGSHRVAAGDPDRSDVVEVLGEEHAGSAARRSGRHGPADASERASAVLVVLDADDVCAGGDRSIRGVRGRPLVAPGVDEQAVVEPDAYSVVGGRAEGVLARLEVESSRPANREVVSADTGDRATRAPVVVDRAPASQRVTAGVPVSVLFAKYSALYSPGAQSDSEPPR